ncbi:hypothetical protein CC85DRAFT_101985 [Cutaneotrichosporon oleaginosum]|uniref:Uncharacterized protein n=1 Tax=Cutaneotrichosporon oleaginosum TaxID=879819 RepID=A0A0J0XLE6_9TREE|nr:uncharacterized protein CC85DRAFT_101985 [Cutaneotrichosporon oleaginosum]KLT41908.1 hypothetical protein CC85DRAFT_101985 [Cutaneotrichosporon oleaginosum]TXT12508.1 hypothetical protein COLE_02918 [Cutaneotrichosporon oleaginosum]
MPKAPPGPAEFRPPSRLRRVRGYESLAEVTRATPQPSVQLNSTPNSVPQNPIPLPRPTVRFRLQLSPSAGAPMASGSASVRNSQPPTSILRHSPASDDATSDSVNGPTLSERDALWPAAEPQIATFTPHFVTPLTQKSTASQTFPATAFMARRSRASFDLSSLSSRASSANDAIVGSSSPTSCLFSSVSTSPAVSQAVTTSAVPPSTRPSLPIHEAKVPHYMLPPAISSVNVQDRMTMRAEVLRHFKTVCSDNDAEFITAVWEGHRAVVYYRRELPLSFSRFRLFTKYSKRDANKRFVRARKRQTGAEMGPAQIQGASSICLRSQIENLRRLVEYVNGESATGHEAV